MWQNALIIVQQPRTVFVKSVRVKTNQGINAQSVFLSKHMLVNARSVQRHRFLVCPVQLSQHIASGIYA